MAGLGATSRVGDFTLGMGGAGGFVDGCFRGASGGFWAAGGFGGAVLGRGGSGGGAFGGVGARLRPLRSTGVGGFEDPREARELTDSWDLDGGQGLGISGGFDSGALGSAWITLGRLPPADLAAGGSFDSTPLLNLTCLSKVLLKPFGLATATLPTFGSEALLLTTQGLKVFVLASAGLSDVLCTSGTAPSPATLALTELDTAAGSVGAELPVGFVFEI